MGSFLQVRNASIPLPELELLRNYIIFVWRSIGSAEPKFKPVVSVDLKFWLPLELIKVCSLSKCSLLLMMERKRLGGNLKFCIDVVTCYLQMLFSQ